MRLWHQSLLPLLPNKQLGGQWVEIRMILGTIAKHGKVNHSTVNYVNRYSKDFLLAYGYLVYVERRRRGLYSNPEFVEDYKQAFFSMGGWWLDRIFIEHDEAYLEECLLNLEGKGIYLRYKLSSVGSQGG